MVLYAIFVVISVISLVIPVISVISVNRRTPPKLLGQPKLNFMWSLLGKSLVKTVYFSETIAASDLKISRSRHLIEYMKICKY